MKRCSALLITRKMLIKPHWDTISQPSIWQNSKAWQEHSPSHTLLVGMQNDISFKKRTMAVVKETTHVFTFLTQQTAIPLLGIYTKLTPLKIWKYICRKLFVTALCVTAKYWKLHKCPNVRECLTTVWYIHTWGTMEYYVTVERMKKFPVKWQGVISIRYWKVNKAQ